MEATPVSGSVPDPGHPALSPLPQREREATVDELLSMPSCSSATPDSTPVVFVVDDDVSARASLEMLIGGAGWQAEAFTSAEEFLSNPRAIGPSCLVLDVARPQLIGLDLLKQVAVGGGLRIIFVTADGDVPMSVEAIKAGADDFLMKPVDGGVMLSAIAQAIEHSRAVLGLEAEMRTIRDRYATLSCRERQVMALVVSGLLNKQVGAELGISEITVKAHRGKVMRKMNAGSFAGLVNIAARLGVALATLAVVAMFDSAAW
jgi:FixJ family two-component response regulator